MTVNVDLGQVEVIITGIANDNSTEDHGMDEYDKQMVNIHLRDKQTGATIPVVITRMQYNGLHNAIQLVLDWSDNI